MSHIADSNHDAPTLFHQPRPFKSTEQSKGCWATRNIFYGCLDKNNVERPPMYDPRRKILSAGHGSDKMVCKEAREEYERSCPHDWVTFFNHRRILECRLRDFDEHAAEDVRQGTEMAAKKHVEGKQGV